MAESYRGLTIRIGADTTGLGKALKEINSAAKTAQTQLRALSKAARIDPGNANVATQQIGAMARAAMDSAAKLQLLRRAQDEVGAKVPEGATKSIAELAAETDNAGLKAEQTKRRYAGLEDELKRIYDGFNKVISDYGLEDQWSPFRFGDDSMSKVRDFLGHTNSNGEKDVYEEVRRNLGLTADEMAQLESRTDSLKQAFEETFAELQTDQQVAKFEDLNVEIAKTEATTHDFNDQLGRLRSSDIAQGLTQTVNEFNLLNTAAKVVEDRFDRLDKAVKLDPNNMEIARDRARALAEATDLAEKKAKNLKERIAAYDAAGIDKLSAGMTNVEEATERALAAAEDANTAYGQSVGEVDRLKRGLDELTRKGKQNTDEYKKQKNELNAAENEMAQLKRASDDANKSLADTKKVSEYRNLKTELGEVRGRLAELKNANRSAFEDISAGAVVVSSAITATLNQVKDAALQQAEAVDSAYRDLRKTLNATENEYQDLRDAAIEFSQTHVTSAETMLEMEALAAQVGIAADELQRFAETAANLDIATDIDAEDIALKMGQMVNVMDDLTGDNVDQFADALVRLGNNMPAQESAILNISQRLSSFGDIVGFTTPEILAWSTAIASTGQKSEAAATAISNTIGKIEEVVAAGGDDLQAYAEVAGMTAEEFAHAWETRPSAALREFIDGLRRLDEDGGSAITVLEDLELTGVRREQALLGLSQTIENLDDALIMSRDAWDGVSDEWGDAGDAAREAQRKSEGLSGQLAIMSNNAQAFAAALGDAFLPYVQLASGALKLLADVMNSLPTELRSVVVGIVGLGGTFLAAAPALFSYGEALRKIVDGFRRHRNAMIAQKQVQAELQAAQEASAIAAEKEAVATAADAGAQSADAAATEAAAVAHTSASGAIVEHLAALAGMIPASTLAVAAIGALAAVIGTLTFTRIAETNERLNALSDSVDEFDSVTADAISPTARFTRENRSLGEVFEDTNRQIEDFTESLSEHSRRIAEIRDDYDATSTNLDRLSQVSDEYVGAGEASTEAMGELEWAARTLSNQLGYNITAEDLLKGTYEDEEGTIHNLRDEIEELIDTRQREAEISAYSGMYEELVQAHAEALDTQAAAENAYYKEREQLIDDYMNGPAHMSRAEAEAAAEAATEIEDERIALEEATRATEIAAQAQENMAYMTGLVAKASDDAASGLDNFMAAHQDMLAVVDDNNLSLQTFQEHLETVGISEADLAKLTDRELADMASSYDGSIQSILNWIEQYNNEEMEDKNATVSAQGNIIDTTAYQRVHDFIDMTARLSGKSVRYDADGNIIDGSALNMVEEFSRRIDILSGKAGKYQFNASLNFAGGVARHMAGGIVPNTTLTPHGIVGEAGAEYYDGNNIVPLTRTNVLRYADGFTDVIADKVASRIGVGNSSVITIGDLTVNNDEELEAAVRRVAVLAARRRDM